MSLTGHLEDAIRINRERLPLYSRLTDGASEPISRRLVRWEILSLPFAWYVDRRARRWQARGVLVVEAEFVPMSGVPEFRERAAEAPLPLSAYAPPELRRMRRALREAYRGGGFPGLAAAVEAELARLAPVPTYHCMLRHVLESALRIANLAPVHAARAEAVGMPPPTGLSRLLLEVHLRMLPEAARLDARAAPLQARGIPILCQDVPPIPPR